MGVRTAVLLYINPQYAYNTKSEWVKIITRSLVYPEEPVMMKSRKLTENLPRNIILTRISLQEQRRGSRRLVRHMTCCLMLRRSRFMISMVRMGSRGVWGVDHRLEGCQTLEMVQDSATLTMETPEPHFHSSLEGAILLLHSSLPIQEVWEELKGWILILRAYWRHWIQRRNACRRSVWKTWKLQLWRRSQQTSKGSRQNHRERSSCQS